MSFLIGKDLKLNVVRVLNLAPVNIFCILFECTVQCPCGKSNCTFWATQLAKAKHTAAIHSESLRRKHNMPAGQLQVFLLHGRRLLRNPQGHPWALDSDDSLGARKGESESWRLRSLCHKQKPVSHLMVPATASRDPMKYMATSAQVLPEKLKTTASNQEFRVHA